MNINRSRKNYLFNKAVQLKNIFLTKRKYTQYNCGSVINIISVNINKMHIYKTCL